MHTYNPAQGGRGQEAEFWEMDLLGRKKAGDFWDALVAHPSLSLQNLCLKEKAALLEIFYELHGH